MTVTRERKNHDSPDQMENQVPRMFILTKYFYCRLYLLQYQADPKGKVWLHKNEITKFVERNSKLQIFPLNSFVSQGIQATTSQVLLREMVTQTIKTGNFSAEQTL
jgi:hypothetical protein